MVETTQKSDTVRQVSTNIKHLQSKPTSQGIGGTEPYRTSSTSDLPDTPSTDSRKTDVWIQDLPPEFQDVNVGVQGDMMELARKYFQEVELAAADHHQENSISEVLEQRKRFSLWTDGEGDLDEKLHENPTVRGQFVSNLTAIVLDLSTGSIRCSVPN